MSATCVGVLETTKFRDMLRQSPFPNFERPRRNRRCSSSVQGMPFLLSCSLFAGFCNSVAVRGTASLPLQHSASPTRLRKIPKNQASHADMCCDMDAMRVLHVQRIMWSHPIGWDDGLC